MTTAAAVIAQATACAAVRSNADLRELVDLMPIPDEGKEAVWNMLALAYMRGVIDTIREKM